MLVIPDVEKWKSDKDFYDRKYLNYIKKSWTRELQAYYKKIVDVKKQETKDKYQNWINNALNCLYKIDEIINDLN